MKPTAHSKRLHPTASFKKAHCQCLFFFLIIRRKFVHRFLDSRDYNWMSPHLPAKQARRFQAFEGLNKLDAPPARSLPKNAFLLRFFTFRNICPDAPTDSICLYLPESHQTYLVSSRSRIISQLHGFQRWSAGLDEWKRDSSQEQLFSTQRLVGFFHVGYSNSPSWEMDVTKISSAYCLQDNQWFLFLAQELLCLLPKTRPNPLFKIASSWLWARSIDFWRADLFSSNLEW